MTKHIRELAPSGIEKVSRRGVLKGLFQPAGSSRRNRSAPRPARADAPTWGADGMPHCTANNPLAFVSIAPDGTVTIVCHRSEMGQGVRTGMPLIVADELEADWTKVKIAQATGDEVQIRQPGHGRLALAPPFHRADASGRRRRAHDAGGGRRQKWGVAASEVEAKNRSSTRRPGKTLGYGGLAADASKLTVPAADSLRLNNPSQFRYIGKEGAKSVDGFNITTGRAIYGQDVRLPGQKYAVVARPRSWAARWRRTTRRRRRRSQASSRSSRFPRRPTR